MNNTKQQLKVCFVSSSFPRYIGDISAPWLLKTARYLTDSGVSMSVFAPSYKGLKQKECDGIRVYRYRYAPAKYETLTHEESSGSGNFKGLKHKIAIMAYMVSGCLNSVYYFLFNKCNIITVHWPIPHAIFGIIGRLITGSRLVYFFHGYELLIVKQYRMFKPFFNFLIGFADHIVANSSYTGSIVKSEFNIKVPLTVIPMGSTFLPVADVAVPALNTVKKIKLLFVGKLIERKGVLYLLKAVKLLKEKRPDMDLSLTIVGSGDQEPEIRGFIKLNELESIVHMKGALASSSKELSYEYGLSDIVVVPSFNDAEGNTEALGCVSMEAMAHRKIVIASSIGGIPDVVKDKETGFLVPEKDPDAIAETISFISDNYDYASKIAENGYKYVKDNFSWDNIISKLLKVYRE
ncbi:MAG: GDP-mannose-dependent alpha-(1-6)-phosphatidylinositol monomannoside mannosyltransferase [Elusimicrobia bacterium ADurb.Bin231]|nr:MAG: GDP-mannose-dependent alpha-(1-6)-phosphatidylinositol monomannoside mannosyltransferase [Elusimicrobia bacterium ADurb.Bin231]